MDTLIDILFCKSVPFEINQAVSEPKYERQLQPFACSKDDMVITFSVKMYYIYGWSVYYI